jgi:integrase
VKAVADAFLSDVRSRARKNTHGVYGYLLGKVTNAYGEQPATSLTVKHFLPWVHALPVSRSTRADVARVTATAFRWAEAEALIPANPLKGMRRPTGESRGAKAVVTADTHAALLTVAHSTFGTLLTLLWETGARPSELSRLTAANVDLANGVAVLMDHKTAEATGRPRLIALTPNAVAVLKALAEARPQGPLLRTRRGEPWTKDRIARVMSRACKAAKVKATAYGYRHGYATQALIRGLPDATVAALLGHSSTTMLHKHYSHLTAQARAMREAAAKVWG